MVRRAPIPTLTCHFLRLSYLLHACRWREAGRRGKRGPIKGQLLLKGCTLSLQDDADGNFAVHTTASPRKLELRIDGDDGGLEAFRNALEEAIQKANRMMTDAGEWHDAAAAAKEQLETAAIEWDEEVFNERVLATVKSTAKWNPPKAGKQSACRRAALRLGRKHLLRLLAASDVDHDDVRGKVQCFFKLAKVLLKKDGITMATKKPSKTLGAVVGQFRTATE